jgi:hypothetical protein
VAVLDGVVRGLHLLEPALAVVVVGGGIGAGGQGTVKAVLVNLAVR